MMVVYVLESKLVNKYSFKTRGATLVRWIGGKTTTKVATGEVMMPMWSPWQHGVRHAIVITSRRKPGPSTTVLASSKKTWLNVEFYSQFLWTTWSRLYSKSIPFKTISSRVQQVWLMSYNHITDNTVMLWIRPSKQAENCSCLTFKVWACYTDVCVILWFSLCKTLLYL